MSDLFDATAMYDEDYLHFFAAPPGVATFAEHGPALPGNDRDWLLAAGFAAVAGYGEDAQPLTATHKRMVIVANVP